MTYLPEPDATDILQRELARSFLTFDDKIDALMENPEWLTAHAAVIWNAAIRSSLGEDAFELLIAGLQLDDVRKGLLEFADSPRFALLVERLAQLGHPSEAVCAARSKEGKVRDASLARLAQHLASDEIEQLWSVCRSDDSYGHDIVLWLLPWLPDAERAGAVDLAFKRASGYALRRGIRKLADLDVERTVDAAVRGLPFDRVKALRALMAIIPSDHVSAQRRVLDGALQHVYTQSRSSALEIIAELAPYIANLGGADAVRETLRAIDDVTRWWP